MPALRAIPYLVLLALIFSVFPITTDDAYITLRYAHNLVAGHGPVFNVGERVEGYSSPMHVLLMAGSLLAIPGADPLFLPKLAGVAFSLLAIWQAGRLARSFGLDESGSLLAQLLVALNVNVALAAVNGLETMLYANLVIALAVSFVAECRQGRGSWSALFGVLMLLARPESFLLIAVLLIVRIGMGRSVGTRFWVGWLAPILAALVLFEVWRFAYYGDLLPNTYYAKRIPLTGSLPLGLRYFLRGVSAKTLMLSGIPREPLLYLGVAAFWALAVRGIAAERKTLPAAVGIVLLLGSLLFMLRSGGDWMLGWRFMAPLVPTLAVFQAIGARALVFRSPVWAHAIAVPAMLVALVNAPRLPWWAVGFATDGRTLIACHGGDENGTNGRLWVPVGDYLHDHVPTGSRVVYSEMGYSGFVNLDKPFLDLRGLTSRAVALAPTSFRGIEGVQDLGWFRPDSPIYPIVAKFHPDVLVATPPTGEPELLGFRQVRALPDVEVFARGLPAPGR